MYEHLGESGGATCPNLPPDTLAKVDNSGPDGESPTEIAYAVVHRVEREIGNKVGIGRVTDETTGSMSVKAEHKKERKVMSVPECFEALGADFVMRGGVHEDQDEEHEVAGNATRLCVVNVEGLLRPDFLDKMHVSNNLRTVASTTYEFSPR